MLAVLYYFDTIGLLTCTPQGKLRRYIVCLVGDFNSFCCYFRNAWKIIRSGDYVVQGMDRYNALGSYSKPAVGQFIVHHASPEEKGNGSARFTKSLIYNYSPW